MLSVDIK